MYLLTKFVDNMIYKKQKDLMPDGMKICTRCRGRKDVYKMGGSYSLSSINGKKVKCPLCVGKGHIPTLDNLLKDDEANDSGKRKTKENKKPELKKVAKKSKSK